MDTRKQAIIDALRTFLCKRPGFDSRNYGDAASYRADMRTATRQRDDAMQFLRDIELRDSISADDILKEAQSGRVTLKDIRATYDDGSIYHKFAVDYCTGQYWCTEYRGAVARLCANVLWTWKRDKCMPPDDNANEPLAVRYASVQGMSPGDWLRASFKREYGRTLAGRYFT